jgi:hypothetical protein
VVRTGALASIDGELQPSRHAARPTSTAARSQTAVPTTIAMKAFITEAREANATGRLVLQPWNTHHASLARSIAGLSGFLTLTQSREGPDL